MMPNPLNKTDMATAQAGLYECSQCQKLANAIAACGLACQEEMTRNQQLQMFFQGLLDQFNQQAWAQASG